MSSPDPAFEPPDDGVPPVVPLDFANPAEIPYVQPVRPEEPPVVELPPPDPLPAPPAPRPPHPGFWWAVVWCLIFLIFTQILPVVPIIVPWIFYLMYNNPGMSQKELMAELM